MDIELFHGEGPKFKKVTCEGVAAGFKKSRLGAQIQHGAKKRDCLREGVTVKQAVSPP